MAILGTLACIAAYFMLPNSQGMILGIAERVLPVAYVLAAFIGLAAADAAELRATRYQAFAVCATLGLAVVNLLYLWKPLERTDRLLGEIRGTIAQIPRGAHVLPILTRDYRFSSLVHASEFAVIDRGAFTPYLFSGDQHHPQSYFRYRDRPYAPTEAWFLFHHAIDWKRVHANWPYILVVGPLTDLHIPYPVEVVAATPAATLLRTSAVAGESLAAR
jgi:hypothetical protein